MTFTRRQFLRGASALGASAALGACRSSGDAAVAPSSVPPPSPASRPATTGPGATTTTLPTPAGGGTLVVLTLYGGNDGLNTVAPVADPTYRSLRGSLALDPATAHDLGDGFALHPSLAQCKRLWDEGRLGVVHGVGFDALDRSHFHCMDVWQAGGEHDLSTGWVGRWLDAVGTEPLDAVAVGRRLPLLARGSRRLAAVVPPGPFSLPGDERFRALVETLTIGDAGRPALAGAVADSTADLLSVVDTVAPVLDGTSAGADLADSFATVAALIESDVPTRVFALELGGFDTHAVQPATHDALLSEVDAAVGGFLDRLGDRPVTVFVYSEFGRRVKANASDGTDHGAAGIAFIAGRVVAGHHGDPSPLDELVDGDLRTTVDFRAVYGGLVEGVLGIDAADIVGPGITPLTLV